MAVPLITINIPPIAALNPKRTRKILREEVGQGLVGITDSLVAAIQDRTPVGVSGGLRAGFTSQVTSQGLPRGVLVRGRVSSGRQSRYARYVEFGTDPHWAPIAPLKRWARRVLHDERAAYAVQWAIARRGTRGVFMVRDGTAAIKPSIRPRLELAVRTAVRRLERVDR